MADEFDYAKFAAELVSAQLDRLGESLGSLLASAKNRVKTRLVSTFAAYIKTQAVRHSRMKTFFHRNEPVHIYDYYVPIGVSCNRPKLREAGYDAMVKIAPCCVITGTAGCGKTTLMRHLFLDCLKHRQKIPVLLELRELNQRSSTLIEMIIEIISKAANADASFARLTLQRGSYAFFLDGFDEVVLEKKDLIMQQIHELCNLYPQNTIILSSRPEATNERWSSMTVWTAESLSVEQAVSLIKKLPYDDAIRNKFIKDLPSLFRKHQSFLSNPLLLTIMLLCYGQSADIPQKLNVFYAQAFEALFQHHDARKDAYQRDRETKLDIQDFASMFSAFCVFTYDERKFEFTKTEALEAIGKASALTGIEVLPEALLRDLIQSVCLLCQDGLTIVFSHRSFQEYFVARYIKDATSHQEELIHRFRTLSEHDNVIALLHEMDSHLIERVLILPALDALAEVTRLGTAPNAASFTRYLKHFFSSFSMNRIDDTNVLAGTLSKDAEWSRDTNLASHSFYHFVYRRYEHELPDQHTRDITKSGWNKINQRLNRLFFDGVGVGELKSDKLSARHPFVKELLKVKRGWPEVFEALFKIREIIRQKHQLKQASLESMLLRKKR